MASSSFNINSGWTSEWISATVGGQIYLYVNQSMKLAMVIYSSQTAAANGIFTMPSWIVPTVTAYGALRNDGYLSVTADSTQGTIVNSAAYSVGQIVFPIK